MLLICFYFILFETESYRFSDHNQTMVIRISIKLSSSRLKKGETLLPDITPSYNEVSCLVKGSSTSMALALPCIHIPLTQRDKQLAIFIAHAFR